MRRAIVEALGGSSTEVHALLSFNFKMPSYIKGPILDAEGKIWVIYMRKILQFAAWLLK
jgi:hypothetical protein